MRIVHLTASTFLGGPERQILGLAQALAPDCQTTVLSFSEGGRCRALLIAARDAGVDADELSADTPRFGKCIREIALRLRNSNADVLITHGYKSNLLGRPAARRAGVPIVSVSRGWTGENVKVKCYDAIDRLHLRLMDRVVCVSHGQAERVRSVGVPEDKIRVIHNAARLEAFVNPNPMARSRLRSFAGGDGPIVLAAGRLSREKGFDVLVKSARKVVDHFARVRFVLFGAGTETANLRQLVSLLGLDDCFRLSGFQTDLDALVPWADVVVLPSFSEGLPNIALEASSAGIPIVATAVGGTPEVVIDGVTGFLVPPGDSDALAERILEVLRTPGLARRFGAAGRDHMKADFSFTGQALEYQRLFEGLTTKKPAYREPICA